VVKNAEQYYRSMFRAKESSWNLRDQHMMDTLLALMGHLDQAASPAKVVVWAHNSHLGNASATAMHARGEFNLGQLVRERFGREALLVGFSTHHGTVTAASDWDGPAERKAVRPALPESYEAQFHAAGLGDFLIDFTRHPQLALALDKARLERAIGVIYRPKTERSSHYFSAHLPRQFDAVLHFDETRAVEPLERVVPHDDEVQETYPSGL
jgi:erythromycin esterase-like protein